MRYFVDGAIKNCFFFVQSLLKRKLMIAFLVLISPEEHGTVNRGGATVVVLILQHRRRTKRDKSKIKAKQNFFSKWLTP